MWPGRGGVFGVEGIFPHHCYASHPVGISQITHLVQLTGPSEAWESLALAASGGG